ncbi:MAG: CHASE domain-containing protein [Betaproteobacteria bacterium]|nr:CHASE domain-containing protein [Betaproteobacteria bacterium]MBK8916606.1 CHASE domain-containing protein [Betaproteobacteria bacterium]
MKFPTPPSLPRPSAHLRWVAPVVLFLLLAALACSYGKHRRLALEESRNQDFQREAAQATYELRERLQFHGQFIRDLAAFFASSEAISAEEWRLYTVRTDAYRHLPGMIAYGFAPRIERSEVGALEARVRQRDGGGDFTVYPAGDSPMLVVVDLLAAGQDVALRARGFDLYSEPARREALERAIDVDDIVVSRKVVLVHDEEQSAFLMLRAVYRAGAPIGNVQERRAAFAGVAYAAYRMSEFLDTTQKTMVDTLALRVFDQDQESGEVPFHSTRPALDWDSAPLHTQHEVDFGGRTWRLEFAYGGGPAAASLADPALIIVGGLTISLLLSLGVFLLLTQKHMAMAYAAQATADLRQAEAAIRARDQFKQAILDCATEVSIIATDVSGTITLFNRGAEKLLGREASDMLGKATPAAFHREDEIAARSAELSRLLQRPVEGFQVFTALPDREGFERREWTYRRVDGALLRVDLTVTALRGADGSVTGYLGIAIDVSDKHAAEEKLARQHDMVQTILANVPCGISLIDPELNFIAANQRLLEVLDFPPELFAPRTPTFREVALFNARRGEYGPGDPEALADALMAKAANPQAHQFERTRPDGRVIEVRGTPLSGGGFVTIYTDITDRKRIEAELRRHRDNLQELVMARTADLSRALTAATRADRAKSEFLANMSHELRTPMHAIMSFSRLGMERAHAAPEKAIPYFERIRQSAERLVVLINDLLDLSRLEAGRMPMHKARFDLAGVVGDAIRDLESLLTPHALTVSFSLEARDCSLIGDAVQIARVVHNLLANAIKFSPPGGEIGVRIGETLDCFGTPTLMVEFCDRGVGIPASELDQIFEKFVQSSTTKTGAGGTGLGLAISREIIQAHHGTIAAKNNPEGGATFTITLPVAPPTEGAGEPVI